nr:immunoglobulin heavy chain junction region [Mus musculus]
CAMGGIDYW